MGERERESTGELNDTRLNFCRSVRECYCAAVHDDGRGNEVGCNGGEEDRVMKSVYDVFCIEYTMRGSQG